jgi:hypothetical protein
MKGDASQSTTSVTDHPRQQLRSASAAFEIREHFESLAESDASQIGEHPLSVLGFWSNFCGVPTSCDRGSCAFGKMLTQLQGDQLPQWIKAVRADDLPILHTFVNGLERDLAAVTAGFTLPWSSGVVEGHVNRIKMIKRQMYGRAGFGLLRKRVLLASLRDSHELCWSRSAA